MSREGCAGARNAQRGLPKRSLSISIKTDPFNPFLPSSDTPWAPPGQWGRCDLSLPGVSWLSWDTQTLLTELLRGV